MQQNLGGTDFRWIFLFACLFWSAFAGFVIFLIYASAESDFSFMCKRTSESSRVPAMLYTSDNLIGFASAFFVNCVFYGQ